jgi:hypothetical protein
MQTTFTENNKLIAEFMGLKFDKGTFYNMGYDVFSNGNLYRKHELKYHTESNWLMPVVREVLTLINLNKLDFDSSALKYEVLDNDIKQAYKEVLKFIKEYNKQN